MSDVNLMSMPNIKGDFTNFIDNNPKLVFVIAIVILLIVLISWAIPKLMNAIRTFRDKSKISKIHEQTTNILNLSKEIHEKVTK